MKQITEYILDIENILSDDICDKICNDLDTNYFERATTGDSVEDTSERNCHSKRLNKEYDNYLYEAVGKILVAYKNEHPHFVTGLSIEDTGYEHLLYKGSENGEYKMHTDNFDLAPRVLSISFILNDNYDGGDFVFFEDKSYTVTKKKGSAVVFPSNFCFPHAVVPVSNGDRHSIITWIR